MRKQIKNGLVYLDKQWRQTDLLIEDDKIGMIGACSEQVEEVYDANGKYVVPGFIDLHTHGGAGEDVNHADKDAYEKIGHFFATQGTTSYLCSILTDTKEKTLWCISEALKYRENRKNGAKLMGIHLEGPFLSREYKGAMPEELLQEGNLSLVKEYQEAAKGTVRYMTVSPEVAGVKDLIKELQKKNIVVAIGHSGADYKTAWECIHAGARVSTHTFNAMRMLHHHEPAISGAILESDIFCEAICDGRHLHPGTVRLLLKVKGLDRVVAITDSIMAAGMPDGEYKLGVNRVIVEDGDAKLLSGTRAGSTLTMNQALKNLKKFTDRPLEELIPLLTENPAKLIGEFERIGSIEEGKQADIVLLDKELTVTDTFVNGEKIVF